ncbi:MAG: YbgC/FadM family acyl-CoA thioesterase [Actinobacteria bacterium]|nr:acyl-CoA thioesterase [Actinomycetota bacterium]NIT95478.1 acyl-CoA thioesterase [Actinomycetota bacterium]NIV55662.1 YbgC/FadM family acyl-CoA thioesterase [Actinomycetota bacterium]NIX20559.1 YbgC/FadM family acyl-CoA thioesterase [Actinomycetota bacterium]NIX50463.1 YbgC/FadM family acyl-CoA thioesterase [Actinomycetota bacterium]
MHDTPIHVRWAELDPYGHVNHSTYLSYLEHGRIDTLDRIGWGMDRLSAAGFQVVVVRADIRFRRPATAGDDLIVTTGVIETRGASTVWGQRITRDEEVVVEATITTAATTLAGRPTRIPDDLREAIAALTS